MSTLTKFLVDELEKISKLNPELFYNFLEKEQYEQMKILYYKNRNTQYKKTELDFDISKYLIDNDKITNVCQDKDMLLLPFEGDNISDLILCYDRDIRYFYMSIIE